MLLKFRSIFTINGLVLPITIVYLICFTYVLAEWDVSLLIHQDVAGAIGGEAFSNQPIISVFDLKGINKHSNLVGRVVATLEHSSSELKDELLGLLNENGECHVDKEVEMSISLLDGDASFEGLCVNKAAVGYRINYSIKDEFNITLAVLRSAKFTVSIGTPYQIGVVKTVESAFGGIPWDIESIVAVQDRGHNTIPYMNEGTVSVALTFDSEDQKLVFEEDCPSSIAWLGGLAVFEGISINKVGTYKLNFTTDLNLPGRNYCTSNEIFVNVGEPNELIIVDEPSTTVYGSKAFNSQPRLIIVDHGGNLVKMDSTSRVVISLHSNPSNASLSPILNRVAIASEGVVQFKHLSLDKAGSGYRFLYELFTFDIDKGYLIETNITTVGSSFDVAVGLPDRIEFITLPSTEMWAGNQPFLQQPIVRLVDAGGNTVEREDCGTLDAILIPSLSLGSAIMIDTSNDDVPHIDSVQYDQSHIIGDQTEYSAGHNISIIVTFTQEVKVIPRQRVNTTSSLTPPTLELNVLDEFGIRSTAYLVIDDNTNMPPSRLLRFLYTVSRGPPTSEVNVFSRSSLLTNDYVIVDAWERNATIYLPTLNSSRNLLASKNISVHSQSAMITRLSIDVGSGEYGSGHMIDFDISFNRKVSVENNPTIPINVKSSIIIIDIEKLGTSYSKSYFYIWYKNERSSSIRWNASSENVKQVLEKMNKISGSVCVSRSASTLEGSKGYRWAVRFDNHKDDLRNGFYIQTANVNLDHKASNVSLVHLETSRPLDNWLSDDGDETMCTERSAVYISGSGDDTLKFRYEVLPGDSTDKLNFSNSSPLIKIGTESRITNAINDGRGSSVDVKLDSPITFLDKDIVIDTSIPFLNNVTITGPTAAANKYHAGDTLSFSLKFNKNVVVNGNVYLLLNVGRVGNMASYYSGSGTDVLVFQYIIDEKHWSMALSNDYQKTSLILDGGYVRRDSSHPSTDASVILPFPNSPFLHHHMVPVQVNGRVPVITEIFLSNNETLILKERDTIIISVEFSSEVIFTHGPPVLAVSIGKKYLVEAKYVSGNRSNIFQFEYIVTLGDSSPSFPITCQMVCVAEGCVYGASKEGYIRQYSSKPILDADLNLPYPKYGSQVSDRLPIHSRLSEVTIDTSTAPQTKVVSINAIVHENEVVTMGEVMKIQVFFTDIVNIFGERPALYLNIDSIASYESGNGTSILTFRFIASSKDVTEGLNWQLIPGENTPIYCNSNGAKPCKLINDNGVDVDLNVLNQNGPIIDSIEPLVVIDSAVPLITLMYLQTQKPLQCSVSCHFTAGDQIVFYAQFDFPVQVTNPHLRIMTNVVDTINHTNVFAIYDQSISNGTNIAFKFDVLMGQTTFDKPLKIDCDSIDCISDAGNCKIYRKATYPTLAANITLPTSKLLNYGDNEPIFVDAVTFPQVMSVETQNISGVFSPGDMIYIDVIFNERIYVHGDPILLLDVGGGKIASALYQYGSLSNRLVFKYIVKPDHCVAKLDYLDKHSLEINGKTSIIRKASARPSMRVNLILPTPGTKGSLSDNSEIKLDCRKPYISNIWSPQLPGKYSTGDLVDILIEFSRDILVLGKPSILLETGTIDRKAHFISLKNKTTMIFQYEVELGDKTDDLDYWTNESLARSSLLSFDLHGGAIMLSATVPTLHADVSLNPAYGYLGGQTKVPLTLGVAKYDGLRIGKRGLDYNIRFKYFSCEVKSSFEIEAPISINDSAEYHLYGDEFKRENGDSFGATVSLDGNLVAIGAPNKRHPISEVQVLTVQSDTKVDQHEVQLITTELDKFNATSLIQTFITSAAENATISGHFHLTYIDNNYVYATSIAIPSNAHPQQMESLLIDAFPNIAPIKVSKSQNIECRCINGWMWRLTFMDASSGINLIETSSSGLIGENAKISHSVIEKNTTMLSGGFKLSHSLSRNSSRYISFQANAAEVKLALEEDLGLIVKNILLSNMDERDIPQLGRRWLVTFSHYNGPYGIDINVPNLEVSESDLKGSNASVWTHVGFEGRGIIRGEFALSFRKSSFSRFIPYNASNEEVEKALESLDSINDVSVTTRTEIPDIQKSGFKWTITFNSVNKLTHSGWRFDLGGESSKGNMPPLDIDSHLTGWSARSVVEYEFGFGQEDTQAQWMAKSMGKEGLNSGQVSIYLAHEKQWHIEAHLTPSDSSPNDHFGKSISLSGSHIVVGAPEKEVLGDFEMQTLVCKSKAQGGTFTVSFRSHHSTPIPFDATKEEIKRAILGVYGSTTKVHALPEFAIEDNTGNWVDNTGGFCTSSGNNITISMYTPDESGLSTSNGNSGDIETINIDSSNLIGGEISVVVTRKGNRVLSGEPKLVASMETLGKRSGAAYIFNRIKDCMFCPYKWVELIKLTALNAKIHPEKSALFGWSSAMGASNDEKKLSLLIGSPGHKNSSGVVYFFTGHSEYWKFESLLTSSLWDDVKSGARFGHSIALEDDSALIGSPGHNSVKGAVYVFTRFDKKIGFLASQSIYGPSELQDGDEFGYSVALSGNRAVICAPNHNDSVNSGALYTNYRDHIERIGACYVYERLTTFEPFTLIQKLVPTNLNERNRFGVSASISGNKIIIGQVGDFIGSTKELFHDVRGKAHLFRYFDGVWTEISYLFPHDPQNNDLFGSSISINDDMAVVGAPHRGLLDIHSGCASIFDLSFANFFFPTQKFNLTEGYHLTIPIQRTKPQKHETIGFKSIDRNSDLLMQNYITKLFQFETLLYRHSGKTAVDLLIGNSAYGRKHQNGHMAQWMNGMYDYNGRSDYDTIRTIKRFQPGDQESSLKIETIDDEIFESPDENFTICIHMPGMFPSNKGDLCTKVTILDNGDGFKNNKTCYQKLFANEILTGGELGTAIDWMNNPDVMVIGGQTFSQDENKTAKHTSGVAHVFMKSSGQWHHKAMLGPSFPTTEAKGNFGRSIAISNGHRESDLIVIIGAPGDAKAYVFAYDSINDRWNEEAILKPFNVTSVHAEHNFAGRGALELNNDMAFIGAPGLETVFIYRRLVDEANKVSWDPWQTLTSNDYDYDRYDNGYKTHHIHQQWFGRTIASNNRVLVVAAPYADYGNRGSTSKRETFDTDGHYNRGSGKGRVYSFYSRPLMIRIQLSSDRDIESGQFKLQLKTFQTITRNTTLIPFDVDSSIMKGTLKAIPSIGNIDVQMLTYKDKQINAYTIEWTIAFLSSYHDEIELVPLWNESGCNECIPFLGPNSTHVVVDFRTEVISSVGRFNQEWTLQGEDVTSGDRFGYSLDLDGNEVIVGAMYSSAKTRTTWDFETGNLMGWVANGNAFDFQPVYGDNSRRRMVYNGFGKPSSQMSGYPQSAVIQGRYYIGTFEKRPGNFTNYLEPDRSIPEGSIQGDEPTGTLTSDPFLILGDTISFLIGGGCDHMKEYVELLVDGFVTMRATGKCNEQMERIQWQVKSFKSRAAQIRIVDADEGEWGHINVDDIKFSWKQMGNNGGCSNNGGALSMPYDGSKQHYSGKEESPLSGAAYIFVRNCSTVDWISAHQGIGCTWRQDQRLTPSDKRSGNFFGSSVSIDSRKGLALVGSERAPLYGFYKELPSLYPHNKPRVNFPFDQKLENLMKSDLTFSPTDGNLRVINEVVRNNEVNDSSVLAEKYSEKSGATYLYLRTKAVTAKEDEILLRAPHWQSFEHVKFTPPDISRNSLYGTNVQVNGETALVTAARDTSSCCGQNEGSAYVFDLSWHRIRFSQIEYEALEGYHDKVSITVIQDMDQAINETISIGYSTSDLSAMGVDGERINECLSLPIEQRNNSCGDYEQTSGFLHFEPGMSSTSFDIRLMDNLCRERHMKYVQLSLHIPGGIVLQGEHYRAQLKIDDNDWLTDNNTRYCDITF